MTNLPPPQQKIKKRLATLQHYLPRRGPNQYQSLSIFDELEGTPEEGIPFPEPTNIATQQQAHKFDERIMEQSKNMQPFEVDLTPSLARYFMKMGLSKIIPWEIGWMTMDHFLEGNKHKLRENCLRVSQNMGFVPIDGPEKGYSFKNSWPGRAPRLTMPNSYLAHQNGFVISCSLDWVLLERARMHLVNGTGDVIACRSKPNVNEKLSSRGRSLPVGVKVNGNGVQAVVRGYFAEEGPTRSYPVKEHFSPNDYETWEEMIEPALAWRKKHTLRDGMFPDEVQS